MDEQRIREAIAYYKEFRDQFSADLKDYESGSHFTSKIHAGERIAKKAAKARWGD
jgi:hypothetical protein